MLISENFLECEFLFIGVDILKNSVYNDIEVTKPVKIVLIEVTKPVKIVLIEVTKPVKIVLMAAFFGAAIFHGELCRIG